MSRNGDDEKIDKAIERMLDVREKNKTVVSLLIIISLFLLLFLSVQFFQSPQVMVIRTSSNELPTDTLPVTEVRGLPLWFIVKMKLRISVFLK